MTNSASTMNRDDQLESSVDLSLSYVDEPNLEFGFGQRLQDPRDGLTLFGPLDRGRPFGIRIGLVGTEAGIRMFRNWAEQIQGPVFPKGSTISRPPFPGFEAAFGVPMNPKPVIEAGLTAQDVQSRVLIDDPYQRIYMTAQLFSDPIIQALEEDESAVDVWFVVEPDDVHKYCRPKSSVEREMRIAAPVPMNKRLARTLKRQRSMFDEDHQAAEMYGFHPDFHHQMKGRLLPHHMPIQIVRESTLAYTEVLNKHGTGPLRDLSKVQSDIAWNLSTATFYKSGGRPWKAAEVRRGVCYVGLVFKHDHTQADSRAACCGAQMFLDSGDGAVFKGALGRWYETERGQYHLSRAAAKELISKVIDSYTSANGQPPSELFIHGKVRFDDEEWYGFCDAVGSNTNLVGVRIRSVEGTKLYTRGDYAALRGLAYIQDDRFAYLWSRGFTPRLQTYPGRGVPNPLIVDICRGSADIETVLRDVMVLTKLNYNSCKYSDGLPVTLRFADAVGEILTAGPSDTTPPLPFRFYI